MGVAGKFVVDVGEDGDDDDDDEGEKEEHDDDTSIASHSVS